MVFEIRKYGDDVLKQIAKEVELSEINDEFRKFLDDMVETMYETDGIGLAAPQVGVSKRVFVCEDGNGKIRKIINPVIEPLTEETQEFEEGCLSVPGIYKKVERPKKVKLNYLNENGEEVVMKELDEEEIESNFIDHHYHKENKENKENQHAPQLQVVGSRK